MRIIIRDRSLKPPAPEVWKPNSLAEVLPVQEALKDRRPHLRQITKLPASFRKLAIT